MAASQVFPKAKRQRWLTWNRELVQVDIETVFFLFVAR